MSNIFPIDFEEKLTMAQDDYILFSDSEDGNKIKKAQYKNLKGEPGTPGTPGTPGKDGADGAAATITVGSTTTGVAGSSASVTNSGTSSAAVLDFTIPQGAKGEPGEDGQDGADGAAATITVGTTTTLPAGSSATVTNVGTSQDAILNFGIPKGDSGTGSGDVIGPASSTDGHLAVFDGATGKIIKDGGAIPEGNVKSFTLSSTSDLTTAQEAYDWFLAGKQPIIVLSDAVYTDIKENTSTTFRMYRCKDSKTDNTINGDTLINNEFIYLSISSGTVTSIGTLVATVANVLSTTTNYSNPYTPQYDGSPATKKYVDDHAVPTVGTNGQVLTVVSGAAAWANASGGDVLVSTQANNILQSGMKIRAGEETDYANLGSYDPNCLYLTIPDQS